nr:hypothetical protein [Tanacetum cinerariifolium]
MTIETHNWASSAHQEFHKIVREEIFPIVNQVDSRVQNFKMQFLKEAAKFVGDFKSLAKEADDSLAKHKAMELDIERLLKVVISQDVMNIVQKESVVDTSDLQTELEYRTVASSVVYLKGKSKDTSCVSDTQNQLSQKLEKENVELEFQVVNYARENAHLKTTFVKKVSGHKDNTQNTSANTKFAKQPIGENFPKVGMFRISSDKVSRKAKKVPNTVSASSRTKPITVSQPNVITKKNVNSDLNGLSSTELDNTKTRRPQPRSNIKNDRVPSLSKSSRSKNKEAKVEEHHRNLLLSKNNEHMSSACNNFKLASGCYI